MRMLLAVGCLFVVPFAAAVGGPDYRSCPPMRPLPQPSQAPPDKASWGRFVDPARGNDQGAGPRGPPGGRSSTR
jgi:hypothetical protein